MSEKNSLMSNIPPPTELPNFILQQKSPQESEPEASKFNPAIPADKNITSEPPAAQDSQKQKGTSESVPADDEQEELPSMQDIAHALSPITDGVKNSVLFGWVKSGVNMSVQKAKESIDIVVSTLDPQMGQLICKKKWWLNMKKCDEIF